MTDKDKNPKTVNKNGVSVAPDGSGYFDSSLFASTNFAGMLIPPGAMLDVVSTTDMTGAVPTLYPKADFPDYDNFTNPGIKS